MQTYVAVTPREYRADLCCRAAHAAYRIGPDSTLLRQDPLPREKGGLLMIGDADTPPVHAPGTLCEAVLRECARRGAEGMLLDFEQAPRPDLLAFAGKLGSELARKRLSLFLPQSYAAAAPSAFVLVDTALSGGNLREHLCEAEKRYGRRLALDVERVRMDFPLPCRTGKGIPLSSQELSTLLEKYRPSVFFSPDLCARYFTYKGEHGTRFVLFDDAETVKRKLRLGRELGASAAFFLWPEVRDIAEELELLRR